MKKTMFIQASRLLLVGLAVLLTFSSCKKDDDKDDDKVLVEDGTYIKGEGAGFINLDPKGIMKPGRVEGDGFSSNLREGMWEKFAYLYTGKTFHVVTRVGVTETVYGVNDKGKFTSDGSDFQITDEVDRGTIKLNGDGFTVDADGFYHFVVDMTTNVFYIIPVKYIGNTVESPNPKMTQVTDPKTGAGKWEHKDYKYLAGSKFKFRYNDAWKLKDPNFTIFANFGSDSDLNALFMGGGEWTISAADKGQYDVTLNWDPITGFKATIGNKRVIANTDYSDYLLGMIGNGIMVADSAWGWGDLSYENKLPTKAGEVYSWTWNNVTIDENSGGNSWKFRKDNKWAFTVGFDNVTMAGPAAADFKRGSSDGNFGVDVKRAYNLVLKVNADTDKWTLEATRVE